MKLKRLVEQQGASTPYYDLGKDFTSFKHTLDSATEEVKNRFEQAIAAKIKGKKIRARASRGYKQFEKDYDIDVSSVSLDDYYDNYVVVVRNPKGKEYFLKPGFKVQVLGEIEPEKPESEPAETPQSSQIPVAVQPAQGASSQTPTATSAPTQQTSMKEVGSPEQVRKYPKDEIIKDIQDWLPSLLVNTSTDLKQYVPQDGVSRNRNGKNSISYGVTIPVDDVPALSVDQIKAALSSVSKLESDVNQFEKLYTLEKFDVRGGKYVIIIKKVTNY